MEDYIAKLDAEWTNDCQGKKDYDGNIISISTRYWPRGGGVWCFDPSKGKFLDINSSILPSAKSSLILRIGEGEYITLASMEVEAESEEEVKTLVEKWCKDEYSKVFKLFSEIYHDEIHPYKTIP